jgi:hypothetical protein
MKSGFAIFCIATLLLIALVHCGRTKSKANLNDNGTYDVSIGFPTTLNNRLVGFNQPFDIKIFFQTFDDEKRVRKVKVAILDQDHQVVDVLIHKDVNVKEAYVFQKQYRTKVLGELYIKAQSSDIDGGQIVEQTIPFFSQTAVGRHDLKVQIKVKSPLENQVFTTNEKIEFSFLLSRLEGLDGKYTARIVDAYGKEIALVPEENLSPRNFHKVFERLDHPGKYYLYIEAYDQHFNFGGVQSYPFYIREKGVSPPTAFSTPYNSDFHYADRA